jgi:hypothetical protein
MLQAAERSPQPREEEEEEECERKDLGLALHLARPLEARLVLMARRSTEMMTPIPYWPASLGQQEARRGRGHAHMLQC